MNIYTQGYWTKQFTNHKFVERTTDEFKLNQSGFIHLGKCQKFTLNNS